MLLIVVLVIIQKRLKDSGMTKITPKYSSEYQFTSLPGSQDGCFDPGCYRDNITYDASFDQIAELVALSEDCEQEVVNNCSVSQLTNFAWWTGRDGESYTYWHGDQGKDKNGRNNSNI